MDLLLQNPFMSMTCNLSAKPHFLIFLNLFSILALKALLFNIFFSDTSLCLTMTYRLTKFYPLINMFCMLFFVKATKNHSTGAEGAGFRHLVIEGLLQILQTLFVPKCLKLKLFLFSISV